MIEIPIRPWMIDNALSLANEMGSLRNSIRNGSGNLAGFLGEECILEYFPDAKRANTYEWDIELRGLTIEAKTKDRTRMPSKDFEVSVAAYNSTQCADFYFFVSLWRFKDDYKRGFLLGHMRPSEYKKRAKLLRKGDFDPSNKFTVHADCYNMKISELNPFKVSAQVPPY